MAPLNPKDWAKALREFDKVSARLLVGLLAPALVLQFGPWFVGFRSSNEYWFMPTLVMLSGYAAVRAVSWLVGAIVRINERRRSADEELRARLRALAESTPGELAVLRNALERGQQTWPIGIVTPEHDSLTSRGILEELPGGYSVRVNDEIWVWLMLAKQGAQAEGSADAE